MLANILGSNMICPTSLSNNENVQGAVKRLSLPFATAAFVFALYAVSSQCRLLSNQQRETRTTEREPRTTEAQSDSNTVSFEQLVESSYYDSLGTNNSTRRLYKLQSFPSDLRTSGGLTNNDRVLIGKLYSNASSAFEYGLGESTYIAAWTGMPRLSGVDSDPAWISLVRDKDIVPDNYQFDFGDIGPTGGWGFPKKLGLAKQIFRYVLAPLSLERKPFEIYLVDGRFRVACACASFLHAMSTGADMKRVKVLVHDYQDKNRGYQIIETLARKMIMADGLAVFMLLPNTTQAQIQDVFKTYQSPTR